MILHRLLVNLLKEILVTAITATIHNKNLIVVETAAAAVAAH